MVVLKIYTVIVDQNFTKFFFSLLHNFFINDSNDKKKKLLLVVCNKTDYKKMYC